MIQDGLIYDKTVDTNKIVFKGQTYQKISSYIFTLIIFCWSLGVSYYIIIEQIKNKPSITDYFVAIFFSGLILAFAGFEIRTLLTRDKLKEIEITISIGKAKTKLLEATANLNWELYSNYDNYMVFRTKNSFLNDCQTITLIFFPNNRVFFHCINFPNNYIRRSRFTHNFEQLLSEYQKIEK